MGKKLTYEYVYDKFKERGCELLETEYINNSVNMRYICKCGNISFTSYNNFRRQNSCLKCKPKKLRKYSYIEIKTIIEQYQYNLITHEDDYKDTNSYIVVQCPSGHTYRVRVSSFLHQDSRCKKCAAIKQGNEVKHEFDFIKKHINIDGYQLLDDVYINNKTKMNIMCPKGHLFKMCYNNFVNIGQRCPNCFGTKKYEYKEIKEYFNKFEYTLLSNEYINAHSYIEVKCKNDHIFKIKFNNFKNMKQRCKQCYVNENLKGDKHPNWKHNRDYITINKRLRRSFEYTWIKNNMKNDPNYNNWKDDHNIFCINHIIPVVAFSRYIIRHNLIPENFINIINDKKNLRIITKTENSLKKDKYNEIEFFKYLNENFENIT